MTVCGLELCLQAGANMIVSGSAVVKNDNPSQVISTLREAVESALSVAQDQR